LLREKHAFISKFQIMGFRENLRSELDYTGMIVKELAMVSGVNKHTIENYLNTHNCIPSADVAVRIAGALGVTVEYLVTGHERQETNNPSIVVKPQAILKSLESLTKRDRKIVLSLIRNLKEMEDFEKKTANSSVN
jgi:transcriptional regulator with XRE-family HTH domain